MVLKIHRLAHWLHLRGVPALPWMLRALNRIVFSVVLPPSTKVGKDVTLAYEGLGTVIHRDVVIGNGVYIGSGVTIGGRSGRIGVAVIEDGVMVGTGAKILGPVHIGRCASIGANSVVLTDVPAFAVAVGAPAKVVRINREEDIPTYIKQ